MSFIPLRIAAGSFSRLKTWEECPAKAKYKFLLKLPEPDSPYAARGTDLHALSASYIKGEVLDIPAQLSDVVDYLNDLKHADTKTELQLAYDKDWKPTEWFAMNVYCRVIFDALKLSQPERRVLVVDHKTGKKREEEHVDQLRLYALAAFSSWDWADVVDAQVIYIDHGERMRMEFRREVLPMLKEYWNKRLDKMTADDVLAPRPNPGCKWCHYRKSNGGPCQFG
jgi:CRISPR/Cas system-associated exonuclease Cas4 (RecB family)